MELLFRGGGCMSRKKKMKMEYRFYEVPEKCPVLALLGEKWVQNYGYQIDYLHFHNLLEIGFCYSGEGTVILKEAELPYHGDMFTVVPKNFPHTTNSLEHQMCSWAWLFIDVEGFLAELYQNNTRMAQKLIARINQKAHLVRCTEKPEVAELIRMLIRCMDEKQEFYLEEAKGLTRALLMQIARWNEKDEKQEKDTVMENASITMILPALNYIRENYREELRVEELATVCHISETHLRRIFQESFRMSPVEYINWFRVRTACKELRKTNLPVSDVALHCGFTTISTFNRNFRRILEVSPQEWRSAPENYEQKLLKFDIKTKEGW